MYIFYRMKNMWYWLRYNLPAGLKNLYLWFKIMWKDRNYDYVFIYEILQHKLKLMEKRIRTENRHVNAQECAGQIRVCLDLLDHLIGDRHMDNLFETHIRTWGQVEHKLIPTNTGTFTSETTYEKASTPEEQKQAIKESRELVRKAELFKEKSRLLLFKLIGKHIVRWWD